MINDSRERRLQDILERIENIKRLIIMEHTLMTGIGVGHWRGYKAVDSKGQAFKHENLLDEVREEIRLQLLSVTALCDGDNPDLGEPYPMLEWTNSPKDSNEHPADIFWNVWQECLTWNA